MRTALLIFSTLFLIVFYSCGSTDSNTTGIVELQVDHYQTVASGPFPGLYFLTQSNEQTGDGEWSVQYSPIENFDYEWGYRYKILTEKKRFNEETDEPLMDAPPYRYIFLEEVSKTKVNSDSTFEIILQRVYDDGGAESFVSGTQESGFTILDSKPFDCANICNQLVNDLNSNNTLTGIFRHVADSEITLVDLRNSQ